MSPAQNIDPITVAVIASALSTIAEEMGKAIIRAAYSTNIKERQDCSTAVFDPKGRTLALAEHIPIHLGSLLGIAEHVLNHQDLSDLQPRDAFIGNDAFTGGGTHLNDFVTHGAGVLPERVGCLGGKSCTPFGFCRSRACAHLPGRATHSSHPPVPRGRAANRFAGVDPAKLPSSS